MNKHDIAAILEEIYVLMELKGENAFKSRSYQAGARTLENLDGDLGDIIDAGKLQELPGIGAALAQKIEILYYTGELPFYNELRSSIPPGLIDMLSIPGLGPKKIRKLNQELSVDTIPSLQKLCKQGKIAELKGFGKKTEENILSGIQNREAYAQRHLWWEACQWVDIILERLKASKDVQKVEAAGSFRRKMETVGDLDFIVASNNPTPIMDLFVSQDEVTEVTAHGETKSSVRLAGGLQADLRVVPPDQYHFALHHFTGSKDHNVLIRQRALSQGYSLSEWGLKPADENNPKLKPISISSEADLFSSLNLAYIPPELREGIAEIPAAESDNIPQLIEPSDIQGVFHNHTQASDGRNTLEEMTAAAQNLGWHYLGIADHSKSSFQANGLNEDRLLKQVESIKALNDSKQFKTHVFSGTECDILKDGSLDFPSEILSQLDYTVVSVHSAFSLPEKEMTARIIKAIEHEHVTMLGHMTGRLLLKREPYALDAEKIIDAAIANNVIIELNANPRRLDMDWRLWRKAAQKGLICSINPDAHSTEGLNYFEAGVNIARKGWLTKDNILNAWTLQKVTDFFKNKTI